MSKSRKCPLVLVEWIDSAQPRSRWEYLSDIGKPEPIRCVSVGWLIFDGKKSKSIAPNMGSIDDHESLHVSGVITIPTCAVTRIKRLRESKKGSRTSPAYAKP